jgi:hypothetical protein
MPAATKSLPPPVPSRPVVCLEDILGCLASHGRKVDRDFLTSVYEFSERMHLNQVRRSGEP